MLAALFQKLAHTLTTSVVLSVESSQRLADDMDARWGITDLAPVPSLAPPAGRDTIDVQVNIGELLLDLGETTAIPGLPEQLTRASGPSALWRYIWALDDSVEPGRLGLSKYGQQIRYHQRTWFSEYLGIAVAAHLMRGKVLATGSGDVGSFDADWAATDTAWKHALGLPADFDPGGHVWPDYFFFADLPGAPAAPEVIVECKGNNNGRGYILTQFQRAWRQLQVLGHLNPQPERMMFGATTRHNTVQAYALQLDWDRVTRAAPKRREQRRPPDEEKDAPPLGPAAPRDPATFRRLDAARLAAYAGAHADAARLVQRDDAAERAEEESGGIEERDRGDLGDFQGSSFELRWEKQALELFCGVERTLLQTLLATDWDAAPEARSALRERVPALAEQPYVVRADTEAGRVQVASRRGTYMELRLVDP